MSNYYGIGQSIGYVVGGGSDRAFMIRHIEVKLEVEDRETQDNPHVYNHTHTPSKISNLGFKNAMHGDRFDS